MLAKLKARIDRASESRDLNLLVTITLTILLGWIVLVQGDFSKPLMNNDAILFMPRVKDWLAHGGWTASLYRADILGGIVLADVHSKQLLYEALAKLGVSAPSAMNIAWLFFQVCFAFLAARSAISLGKIWGGDGRVDVVSMVGMGLIFGFLPVLGARAQYGHLDLAWGLAFYLVLTSFAFSIWAKDFTRVQLVMLLLSLFHAMPSHGHQTKLYSVVFGGMILVATIWPTSIAKLKEGFSERKRLASIAALVAVAGMLMVLPRFWGVLKYSLSSDAARGLDGASVIYAYNGTNLLNWFASLTWDYKLFSTTNDPLLISEFFFPMGPLLLLLPLVFRKSKAAVIGAFVSLFLVVALSLKWEPIASLLQTLVPQLKLFRVPERAILPFIVSIPLFAVGLLLSQIGKSNSAKKTLIFLPIAVVLAFVPSGFREICLWALALFVGVSLWRGTLPKWMTLAGILLLFGVGSAMGFGAWITQAPSKTATLSELEQIGRKLQSERAELKSPLTRAVVNFTDNQFMVHTSIAMGISNLSGYWTPLNRFGQLNAALNKTTFNPTSMYFNLTEQVASTGVLNQLYNVCCAVDYEKQTGAISLRSIGSKIGAAWMSNEIEWRPSWQELADNLRVRSGMGTSALAGRLMLLSGDRVTERHRERLANMNVSACSSGTVTPVDSQADPQAYTFRIVAPSECPVTVATNFSELLHARVVRDGKASEEELPVFPGYGALTTLLAPAGQYEVVVEAEPLLPGWVRVLGWLGAIGFIVGAIVLPASAVVEVNPPLRAGKARRA